MILIMIGNMQPENKAIVDRIEEIKKFLAGAPDGTVVPEDMKVKVAVLADSPTVITGFGNVCKEVLGTLYETEYYSFDMVGINHDGSPHSFPYKIWPAVNPLINDMSYREVYGRQQFLDILGRGVYDIVWILQDTFIVAGLMDKVVETNAALPPTKKFTTILYYPIDATPKKDWIDKSVTLADLPIAYTRYAYEETIKIYSVGKDSLLKEEEQEENKAKYADVTGKLNVIYHGVNTDIYKPLPEDQIPQLKQDFWGDDHKDKFVFISVNRNQPRKDMFRTLLAFKKLLDRRKAKGKNDVYLYTHCSIVDTGLNMIDMSKQIGLVQGDEWAYPDPSMFTSSNGVPAEIVNQFYNASDAVITTTLGEGWGLCVTEAMATKRPVLAPDHTSLSEMLGKMNTDELKGERGILIRTGESFVQHDDNSRVRYVVDVEDMVDKMEALVENRAEYQPMVERAYAWVQDLNWRGPLVGDKWKKIFESAYMMSLARKAMAVQEDVEVNTPKPKWLEEKERRENKKHAR